MAFLQELIQFQFLQNALIASVLTALVCGLLGAYIVVRRIVFVSGGITHASFAGLGLGVYFGLNPIFMAGVTAVLAALGLTRLGRREYEVREDAAIASIWALGMAVGVLFLTLTPGYTSGLSSYLFGNILLVGAGDLYALSLFSIILLLILMCYYRQILFSMFDADFAQTRRLPARFWNALMLVMVAIGLVLSIRLIGIMLLMSLLTLPQTIMTLFTADFKRIMIGAVLIGLLANLCGLLLSYYWISIPSGVSIVLILFLLLGIAHMVRWYIDK